MEPVTLQKSIRELVSERNALRERLRRTGGRDRGGGMRRRGDMRPRPLHGPPPEEVKEKRGETKSEADAADGKDDAVSSTSPLKRRLSLDVAAAKRPKLEADDTTIKRNKVLFGSMMGHLMKARTNLEKEAETKQAELQKQQAAKVQEKITTEKRQMADLRRKEFFERKKQDVDRIKEVERQIVAAETELLRVNLERHYKFMTNFIRTRAEPTIFWRPAISTPESDRLLEETRLQIEQKVAALAVEFAPPTESQPSSPAPDSGEAEDASKETTPQLPADEGKTTTSLTDDPALPDAQHAEPTTEAPVQETRKEEADGQEGDLATTVAEPVGEPVDPPVESKAEPKGEPTADDGFVKR